MPITRKKSQEATNSSQINGANKSRHKLKTPFVECTNNLIISEMGKKSKQNESKITKKIVKTKAPTKTRNNSKTNTGKDGSVTTGKENLNVIPKNNDPKFSLNTSVVLKNTLTSEVETNYRKNKKNENERAANETNEHGDYVSNKIVNKSQEKKGNRDSNLKNTTPFDEKRPIVTKSGRRASQFILTSRNSSTQGKTSVNNSLEVSNSEDLIKTPSLPVDKREKRSTKSSKGKPESLTKQKTAIQDKIVSTHTRNSNEKLWPVKGTPGESQKKNSRGKQHLQKEVTEANENKANNLKQTVTTFKTTRRKNVMQNKNTTNIEQTDEIIKNKTQMKGIKNKTGSTQVKGKNECEATKAPIDVKNKSETTKNKSEYKGTNASETQVNNSAVVERAHVLRKKTAKNYTEVSILSPPPPTESIPSIEKEIVKEHVPIYKKLATDTKSKKPKEKADLYEFSFEDSEAQAEKNKKKRKLKLKEESINTYDKSMDEILQRVRDKIERDKGIKLVKKVVKNASKSNSDTKTESHVSHKKHDEIVAAYVKSLVTHPTKNKKSAKINVKKTSLATSTFSKKGGARKPTKKVNICLPESSQVQHSINTNKNITQRKVVTTANLHNDNDDNNDLNSDDHLSNDDDHNNDEYNTDFDNECSNVIDESPPIDPHFGFSEKINDVHPQRINILTNVVLTKSSAANANTSVASLLNTSLTYLDRPEANSTVIPSSQNTSTPWRPNFVTLKRNPHFLNYKKSALPNYDQEMVLESNFLENSFIYKSKTPSRLEDPSKTPFHIEGNATPAREENIDKNTDKPEIIAPKNSIQSSILDFVPNTVVDKPVKNDKSTLFDDNEFSPIKKKIIKRKDGKKAKRNLHDDENTENENLAEGTSMLGNTENIVGSTPLIASNRLNLQSKSTNKEPANELDNYFGFDSLIEEEEGNNRQIKRKAQVNSDTPSKPMRIDLKTVKNVLVDDPKPSTSKEVEILGSKEPHDDSFLDEVMKEINEINENPALKAGLFEDFDGPPVFKKPSKQYGNKKSKRKRLVSVGDGHSDEEEAEFLEKPKKKKKSARSKAEEAEARKWYAQFNAMCQEVEQHNLTIE